MSSILFNIVADMLAIIINREKIEGQIDGVVPHLIDNGLSILQYADDAIIFMDNNIEKAKNLKLLLYAFEEVSGLKINYHKMRFSVLGMQGILRICILNYLGAKLGLALLSI
jgi:hypothetical protein